MDIDFGKRGRREFVAVLPDGLQPLSRPSGHISNWCNCQEFILTKRQSKKFVQYREMCPCCLKAKVRMRAGIGYEKAFAQWGKIRLSMALDVEELKKMETDYRLEVARHWFRRVFYQEHLASRKWYDFRIEVIKRFSGNCQGCGGIGTDVHHLTYKNLGDEGMNDVTLLCRSCHEKIHNAHGGFK